MIPAFYSDVGKLMASQNVCWNCGLDIDYMPLPLGRYDECKHCAAPLYVCKMCQLYDPKYAKHCREPVAEEVRDKEKANFCDYFKLKPNAFDAGAKAKADHARENLDALFGGLTSKDRDS